MTYRYSTNLRCEGCLASIKPLLDVSPVVTSWSAETQSPQKVLTLEAKQPLTLRDVNDLLAPAGYQALAEVTDSPVASEVGEQPSSYYPLFLILLYLLGVTVAIEWSSSHPHSTSTLSAPMRHFMAGFFLVFSFFKLLSLQKFADAYQTYDIVARQSRVYALAYPFIELGLGIAYVLNWQPTLVNIITLIVMAVSTVGVVQSLLARKTIRCACLGTVFNLPMSVVTLVEDLLMVAMSAAMLLM